MRRPNRGVKRSSPSAPFQDGPSKCGSPSPPFDRSTSSRLTAGRASPIKGEKVDGQRNEFRSKTPSPVAPGQISMSPSLLAPDEAVGSPAIVLLYCTLAGEPACRQSSIHAGVFVRSKRS